MNSLLHQYRKETRFTHSNKTTTNNSSINSNKERVSVRVSGPLTLDHFLPCRYPPQVPTATTAKHHHCHRFSDAMNTPTPTPSPSMQQQQQQQQPYNNVTSHHVQCLPSPEVHDEDDDACWNAISDSTVSSDTEDSEGDEKDEQHCHHNNCNDSIDHDTTSQRRHVGSTTTIGSHKHNNPTLQYHINRLKTILQLRKKHDQRKRKLMMLQSHLLDPVRDTYPTALQTSQVLLPSPTEPHYAIQHPIHPVVTKPLHILPASFIAAGNEISEILCDPDEPTTTNNANSNDNKSKQNSTKDCDAKQEIMEDDSDDELPPVPLHTSHNKAGRISGSEWTAKSALGAEVQGRLKAGLADCLHGTQVIAATTLAPYLNNCSVVFHGNCDQLKTVLTRFRRFIDARGRLSLASLPHY